MSERLTKKDYKDWRNTHGYYNKQSALKITEMEHKLGSFEDVLEKYGVESAEELDGVLKPLIENGELENWKSAMFWKMHTQKQQSRWEELKKWVSLTVNIPTEKVLYKMQELEKESKDEE